jgi:hypothetical protein
MENLPHATIGREKANVMTKHNLRSSKSLNDDVHEYVPLPDNEEGQSGCRGLHTVRKLEQCLLNDWPTTKRLVRTWWECDNKFVSWYGLLIGLTEHGLDFVFCNGFVFTFGHAITIKDDTPRRVSTTVAIEVCFESALCCMTIIKQQVKATA